MKVKGLDGRVFSWDLRNHVPLGGDDRPRSGPHLRARALLQSLFPLDVRAEEVPIPGLRCFLDFVIPSRMLAVEVDGEQHRAMNGFFHDDETDFLRARRRDGRKQEWLELNGFRLVRLPDDQADAEWRAALLG